MRFTTANALYLADYQAFFISHDFHSTVHNFATVNQTAVSRMQINCSSSFAFRFFQTWHTIWDRYRWPFFMRLNPFYFALLTVRNDIRADFDLLSNGPTGSYARLTDRVENVAKYNIYLRTLFIARKVHYSCFMTSATNFPSPVLLQ